MNVLKAVDKLITARLSMVMSLFKLFGLELRLAKLSFYPLLIGAYLLIPIIMGFWLSLIGLSTYWLYLKFGHIWISLLSVVLIQCLIILLLGLYVFKQLSRLKFKRIRHLLSSFPTTKG